MTGETIRAKQKQYSLQSWSKQGNLNPIPVARGEGIYFWDTDGKRYTDMSSQLVNSNLGHGNKAIVEAIKAQADKIPFIGKLPGDIWITSFYSSFPVCFTI